MSDNNFIKLIRDCDGVLIPSGDPLKLKKGSPVKITQSLGGYFTLYINGNLVKLDGKDADAIGKKIKGNNTKITHPFNENLIWDQLRTCFDPEIPVNIVDLGLIYNLECEKTVRRLTNHFLFENILLFIKNKKRIVYCNLPI